MTHIEAQGKGIMEKGVQGTHDFHAMKDKSVSADHTIDTSFAVSIIIPVFNQANYTRRCLEHLFRCTPEGLYELIIVDNHSTDETSELLRSVERKITIVSNESNLGFAVACNQGAALATAPYLLFLNNDTEVQPRWIEPLLARVEALPEVAAVGSKLLYPDGTLQHAGVVIIEQLGECSLLPRHVFAGENPAKFPVDHPMFFQAVTAACLLVRREDFEAVGGFDEVYWNGSEDVDFCFKLQQRGKKILYEPRSVVIHHESASGRERLAAQPENNARLRRRWEGLIRPDLVQQGLIARPGPSRIIGLCGEKGIDPLEYLQTVAFWWTQRQIERNLKDQHNRLVQLKSALEERDSRLVQLKSALEERDNRLVQLKSALDGREADTRQLERWMEQLRSDFEAMLQSKRWKVGNSLVRLLERVMLRGSQPMAVDHIQEIFQNFCRWRRQERSRKPDALPTTNQASGLALTAGAGESWGRPKSRRPKVGAKLETEDTGTRRDELILELPDVEQEEADLATATSFFFENPTFLATIPYNWLVSIVIPFYNGLDDLRQCVESIQWYTRSPFEVILVDDASTEPSVIDFLEEVAADPRFRILRNEKNLGFVASANRGMRASHHDIVLLNSDTRVTPRWLTKLKVAAYAAEDIASVTPFSNAAGAFSVPEAGRNAPLPLHLELEEMSRIVERLSNHRYPTVPTGNGFCLYLKRSALELVGFFDEKAFGRGYGEENDLCMRFRAKGLRNVIDDATFIYHKGNASFGEEKAVLMKKHRALLDERHPEYTHLVREFIGSEEINALRRRIGREMEGSTRETRFDRRRILYVLHEGGGGVPHTSRDLAEKIAAGSECYLLTSDAKRLYLSIWTPDGPMTMKIWELERTWNPVEFYSSEFLAVYREVLFALKIELVHIRHVFKHTFDIFRACEEFEVPVVVSFHDFYLLNPFIHLLDAKGRFHPEPMPPQTAKWHVPSPLLESCPNTPAFVAKWRENVQRCLRSCQAFVTTTEGTRQIILTHYPFLRNTSFSVIEHGRDLPSPTLLGRPPRPNEPVKILCLGNLDYQKGSKLIGDLGRLNAENGGRLEFHFLGTIDHHLKDVGRFHGRYDRDTFLDRIRAIQPHFGAVLSIWAETYSHTLTEFWVAGIPVIGSNLGAVGERIRRTGGGWIVDVSDPKETYRQILEIISNTEDYSRKTETISHMHFKTAGEMAVGYSWLYNEVEARAQGESPPLRIGVFVPEGFKGSSYVRTLLPLGHPRIRRRLNWVLLRNDFDPKALEDFALEARLDAVLVQRDCLDGGRAEMLMTLCRRLGIRMVMDLDDDLLNMNPDHPDYQQYHQSSRGLETLLRVCDRVFVSTEKLAQSLASFGKPLQVVHNALDERTWLCPLRNDHHRTSFRFKFRDAKRSNRLRVLYMGTRTHDEDFRLIEQSVRNAAQILERHHGISLVVDLVGILRNGRRTDPPFNAIVVPPGQSYYPRFVRWLRSIAEWDFGIAPLVPSPFNECKSALKFLEYAALGLPSIFSAVGEYPVVVEDGVTGLLCRSNTPEEWQTHLVTMATNAELRKTLAANALERLHQRFLLRDAADFYAELWQDLCSVK